MDTTNRLAVAIKIFSGIFFALTIGCILLCCVAYILSRKKHQKQNQIHFTNPHRPSEAPTQIFTIDMPDTHLSNIPAADSSSVYLSDQPPPPYVATEEAFAVVQHESIVDASSSPTTTQTS